MKFTRSELQAFHGQTLPDHLGSDVRLLFVGINPGLMTIATGTHFGRPGNRFYPALVAAGILPRLPVLDGTPRDAQALLTTAGIGITNIVPTASARADELTREELRAGAVRLAETVGRVKPRAVAIVGISAYREAFERPKARVGRQPEDLAGSPLWVVPNPSGLNAHDTVATLAAAYAEPARVAGVLPPASGS
jgi:double-stranded uracil-DNA glycosylase